MKTINRPLTVKGNHGEYEAWAVTTEDYDKLAQIVALFKATNALAKEDGVYRGLNVPEVITETAFMLTTGAIKIKSDSLPKGISSASDCYLTNTDEFVELKSAWSNNSSDLTSFSPKKRADVVYFQNFSRQDGTFDIYRLEYDWVLSAMVNKNQTVADQMAEGKRPRLSLMKKVILPRNLAPVMKGYLYPRENFFLSTNVGSGMLAKAKNKTSLVKGTLTTKK